MEKLEQGKIYKGFLLIRSEFRIDMNSHMMDFRHAKTGARVIAVKNDDENKTFCISFNTVPEDSTGVAHILEHCVLSGSEKYPVKDVFAELYKGGLSTFMNAFTAPDSTYYPFSTRNLKEYFNFMSVYLDTTLKPLLKKSSFFQEGWHYELSGKNDPLEYQGIVYNEMKGAMSNPLRQLALNISKTLLPGSTYSFNSGGDPDEITDLSYEKFLDFHKKYYHPSNSTVYLYGNADLMSELEFIDQGYFVSFEENKPDIRIKDSEKISPMTETVFGYGINPHETLNKKTYIAISSVIGRPQEVELSLAMNLISNIIFNSDASPLKLAVMASGIAGDFSGYFDDSQTETITTAYISGSEPEHKGKFIDIYFSVLEELVSEGIDKELILSEINHLEFKQKEKEISSMRGLIYLNRILHLIQYDIDIFDNLNLNPVIQKIRESSIKENYLEGIIKKYLLSRDKTAVVTMNPDPDMLRKKTEDEREKLDLYKRSLSDAQLKELIKQTDNFRKEQEKENSAEDQKKIPKLQIGDIDRKITLCVPEVETIDGAYYYWNEMFTNDIVYISIGLDLKDIPLEHLPYLSLFTELFKETGTQKRKYDDLYKDISSYFGGFDFALTILDSVKEMNYFRPVLYIEIKTLKKFIFKAAEILTDLITGIDYSNKARIKEIITGRHQYREVNLKSEGYDYSVTRLKACVSDRGRYLELVKGLSSYYKVKSIYDDFDNCIEPVIEKLKELSNCLFRKKNIHFGILSDSEGIGLARKICSDISKLMPDIESVRVVQKYPEFKGNEAFLTGSEVAFVSMGGNIFGNEPAYSGRMEVIKNYLSSDYLFEEVRMKGGAYGAWMYFNPLSGFLSMTSYRDPNVARTVDVYRNIPECIRNFKMDKDSFTSLKIGAYAAFDPLLSPYAKGKKAREDFLTGIDQKYVEKIVCDILNTTQEDIVSSYEIFKNYISTSLISAIGNSEKIRKDGNIFEKLTEII